MHTHQGSPHKCHRWPLTQSRIRVFPYLKKPLLGFRRTGQYGFIGKGGWVEGASYIYAGVAVQKLDDFEGAFDQPRRSNENSSGALAVTEWPARQPRVSTWLAHQRGSGLNSLVTCISYRGLARTCYGLIARVKGEYVCMPFKPLTHSTHAGGHGRTSQCEGAEPAGAAGVRSRAGQRRDQVIQRIQPPLGGVRDAPLVGVREAQLAQALCVREAQVYAVWRG